MFNKITISIYSDLMLFFFVVLRLFRLTFSFGFGSKTVLKSVLGVASCSWPEQGILTEQLVHQAGHDC